MFFFSLHDRVLTCNCGCNEPEEPISPCFTSASACLRCSFVPERHFIISFQAYSKILYRIFRTNSAAHSLDSTFCIMQFMDVLTSTQLTEKQSVEVCLPHYKSFSLAYWKRKILVCTFWAVSTFWAESLFWLQLGVYFKSLFITHPKRVQQREGGSQPIQLLLEKNPVTCHFCEP